MLSCNAVERLLSLAVLTKTLWRFTIIWLFFLYHILYHVGYLLQNTHSIQKKCLESIFVLPQKYANALQWECVTTLPKMVR